jgi:hypothetical protein
MSLSITHSLMTPIRILRLATVAATVASAPCLAEGGPLTEAAVLEYAAAPYDKSARGAMHQVLGTLNGAEVVVDFVCEECSAVGGQSCNGIRM